MEILIIIVGCYVAIGLVFGVLSKSPWVGLLWPVLMAMVVLNCGYAEGECPY